MAGASNRCVQSCNVTYIWSGSGVKAEIAITRDERKIIVLQLPDCCMIPSWSGSLPARRRLNAWCIVGLKGNRSCIIQIAEQYTLSTTWIGAGELNVTIEIAIFRPSEAPNLILSDPTSPQDHPDCPPARHLTKRKTPLPRCSLHVRISLSCIAETNRLAVAASPRHKNSLRAERDPPLWIPRVPPVGPSSSPRPA
ncbi:hypothetical protein EJ05DRAFT_497301 [Pseudovirgaria hyperparasitica]|uniref:Uncharacterized protein n=1 Tax=Pseudovirgaria hyperparasitica TaxID=470096 RepID=A0A6A6WHV6_9PEZI|nr:uncharacterized protein EJ05DRAFT_497301 [Pseudovirgaria hyperparasitica]KAF2760731.1 hypothetical protein EJ05DRAFT_497301 [Pseudovirgaria hyperparasitica]